MSLRVGVQLQPQGTSVDEMRAARTDVTRSSLVALALGPAGLVLMAVLEV